jgi:serine/threonine protein kinase
MTQFQVSPNSVFVAGKQLGAGTYGRVFLCANNDSVVIKVEEDYDYDNVFLGEARVYDALGDSNFTPKCYGYGSYTDFETKDEMRFIVVEKFETDLYKLVIEKFYKIDDNIEEMYKLYKVGPCQIATDIIDALAHMHSCGLVHGDLKPENILIKENRVALTDFGFTCKINGSSSAGTCDYMSCDASEIGKQTRRSDLESFGYVLIELFGDVLPWKDDVYVLNILMRKKEFLESLDVDPRVAEYFTIVKKLARDETPDYDKLKSIFGTDNLSICG